MAAAGSGSAGRRGAWRSLTEPPAGCGGWLAVFGNPGGRTSIATGGFASDQESSRGGQQHLTGDHEVPVSRSLLPHVRRVVDTARRKGHPTDPQRSSPHPDPYAAGIVGQAGHRPVPLGDGGPDGSETGERD